MITVHCVVPLSQYLGQSQKEYDKHVMEVSVQNQLRHRGNLVQRVCRDEAAYYRRLLDYSRQHLMLYPYHLADIVVKGLRLSPFEYCISVVQLIMEQERSYDSLPNFTAADCECRSRIRRVAGEYVGIVLMNNLRVASVFKCM